jgi:hypothetical protein
MYSKERYEWLKEVIGEYLDDEGQSPENLLNDLRKALDENSAYFDGRAKAYQHIKEFFQ